jgi:pimeloyl-ACP methyl ester carboxylesterase/DNA-binding winged helix-turn-helix (wHTH) protein
VNLRFADCELDQERRELRRGGAVVHVEPQVFDLLALLIANSGRVVGKDELLDTIWQGRFVSEATLSSRINAARQAVGDNGKDQRLIRTIPRRGFRFVGSVIEPATTSTPGNTTERIGAPHQSIRFCAGADGVHLAVAEIGSGDVLVKTANWLNHLDYDWQSPLWAPVFSRLAAKHRLVRYDARGTGLSDREVEDISFDAFVRDLETVIDATKLERFSLLGISQGAAVSIAYAVTHPERVSKLILHGGYALGRKKRGQAAEDEKADALVTLMRYGWGDERSAFMQAFSSIYLPNGTPEQIRWFSDMQRRSATSEVALKIRNVIDEIDVVALLGQVRAPTLVLHSRFENVVPYDHGRFVAASIPGARFVTLESANHLLLPDEPEWSSFVSEIESFLA